MEILSVCERAIRGGQLNATNAAAALQSMARAEDGAGVASASDPRLVRLADSALALLAVAAVGSGDEGAVTKELAITAWAFARLRCTNHGEGLSGTVHEQLPYLTTQELTGTAWAFAKMEIYNCPLMESLSAEARRRLSDFLARDISGSAWSCAKIPF